ncbi:MAG: hypothetical protein ACYC2H_01115 [Thermoplasmatota archaeon]
MSAPVQLIDAETERQWKGHLGPTGCQRPRDQAEFCIQVGLLAFPPVKAGPLADDELTGGLEHALGACETVGDPHGKDGLLDCIKSHWQTAFVARLNNIDRAGGRIGCTPESWAKLVPRRWF